MRVLGVNAAFHDPSAALVVDGHVVAAAEEERFSRRKHGKDPVPFSAWELPVQTMAWCLADAGLEPADLDAVAVAYDPALAQPPGPDLTVDAWEGLRTLYAQRAPLFLQTALPGLDPAKVRFVGHHLSHAASAYLAAGWDPCSVLVLDGRGERASLLAGRAAGGAFEPLAEQRLPHSLGLVYEALTEHLGFRRASDEYKVMAMASYGSPAFLEPLRDVIRVSDGHFEAADVDFAAFAALCGDTGVAHLATATGTPSVVLFGPVAPHEWGPPPDGPHVALWAGRRGDPHGDAVDPGLLAIEPDQVVRALGTRTAWT